MVSQIILLAKNTKILNTLKNEFETVKEALLLTHNIETLKTKQQEKIN